MALKSNHLPSLNPSWVPNMAISCLPHLIRQTKLVEADTIEDVEAKSCADAIAASVALPQLQIMQEPFGFDPSQWVNEAIINKDGDCCPPVPGLGAVPFLCVAKKKKPSLRKECMRKQ